MKKIIISFLCLPVALGFAACSSNDSPDDAKADTTVPAQEAVYDTTVQEGDIRDITSSYPDQSLIAAGFEWEDNMWKYDGQIVTMLYDSGSLYSNDSQGEEPLYIIVERDDDDHITEVKQVEKEDITSLLNHKS